MFHFNLFPVLFGGADVSERIKHAVSFQTPKKYHALLCMLLSVTLTACFSTSKKADGKELTPNTVATLTPTPDAGTDNEKASTPDFQPVENAGQLDPALPVGFVQPASKVAKADADTDKIPITEAYFSDPVFCEFLKETYDTDKDGFLSKTEREQLTWLSFGDMENWQNCKVLDGLDWFSKLKTLDVGGSYLSNLEVYLYDHPGIELIWGVDSAGAVSLYIDGCENLQAMNFGGIERSCTVGLYVRNCKNLSDVNLRIISAFTGASPNRNKIYCLETPNLRLHLYESMSREIWLDANAQVFPILRHNDRRIQETEKNFTLSEQGMPCWTTMQLQSEKPVAYLNVNWLGLDSSTPTMKTEVEKVLAASEEYMTKKHATVSSLTHFVGAILYSPKNTSIYAVESKYMGANDYVSLGTRYYIVEGDGTLLAYDSLQELSDAADSRTDLPNNLYTFLATEEDY